MIAGDPSWPVAQPLETPRLRLLPLRVEDADEAAVAFDDPRLHDFTGGLPATLLQLRTRYAHQIVGVSPNGSEGWVNWTIRERDSRAVVGTVQATVRRNPHRGGSRVEAELAWVVAVPAQGRGYAREAARAVVADLTRQGVTSYLAHIHPDHHASAAVAGSLRLHPTDTVVDGEVEWRRRSE